MTVVARLIRRSLTLEANAALETYVEVALEETGQSAFETTARLTTLLHGLAYIGGTWRDVLDLIALHEPALEDWLTESAAAQVWAWAPEPAAEEAAAA